MIPTEPLHEQIHAAIQRTAPRHLVTQHPGLPRLAKAPSGRPNSLTTRPLVDYVLHATGGDGDLERACQQAIDWSLRLYHHVPPKPVVNGQAWYEGVAGGTAEIAAQLGYLSFLSGNVGYTYGTSLWNATDADLPAWEAVRGATYMQYLYDFFAALDERAAVTAAPCADQEPGDALSGSHGLGRVHGWHDVCRLLAQWRYDQR